MTVAFKKYWLIPQHVMLIEAKGDVMSLREFKEITAYLADVTEKNPHPLHIIADARPLGRGPMQIRKMQEVSIRFLAHDNRGWVVFIQTESIAKFITSAFIQLFLGHAKMVDTFEGAVTFLSSKISKNLEFLDEPHPISEITDSATV